MRDFEFSDGWLIVALGIMTMAILLLAGSAGAATLTVNASGGADYTKIQDGIDNASAGDTVLVYSGTYYEDVSVKKPLILKGIDTGWGKPVINATGRDNAITLNAGNSTLEGFTVVNVSEFDYGIYLYYSGNSTLRINNVSNINRGIYLYYSSSSTLIGNNVKTNRVSGYAINLFNSSDNTLIGNNLSDNYNGIYLSDSDNTLIGNNNVSDSQEGILISSSGNNTLINNSVSNNLRGIILASSNNNMLSGNNILSNREGIYLGGSSNNILFNNIASNNSEGIYIYRSGDNDIYNNFFNNTNNLRIFQVGYNKWNITGTNGTNGMNVIGGLNLGGNVWANPGGTAFSQTCEDVNNDGICDSSYTIDSNNIDYLPLAYTEKFPTVIINLSGTPVVNQSTIYILSADYRNFNAGSPYDISIIKKDDDTIVYTDNGTLKGGLKETVLINWTPITTGEYLVESKRDNIIVGSKTIFSVNDGAKMLAVDDNGGADYISIRDAIDNASDGDVILVYSGTYSGVSVNRQLILKGIDTGGGKPIIDASAGCTGYPCVHYGPGTAVTMWAGNSTLDGFTIVGGWSFAIPYSGGIDVASDNNLIKNNIIRDNKYGIIFGGSNNTIYNNFFDNSENFGIYSNSSNKWNITRTNGTNIMGGPYLGGNLWERFRQTCMDTDQDGICDARYTLDSNNIDYLPLVYKPLNTDMTSPVINTVILNNNTPDTGEPILVTVNSSDNVEVINVTANGIPLNKQDVNTWSGTINALPGTNSMNVSASDAAGNIAWNNSTGYTALPELTGSISGMKLNDSNGNGIKEPEEQGLANWMIVLKNSDGNTVATNMTDNNGSYTFGELAASSYAVEEVIQPGWTQTAPQGGIYTINISAGEYVEDKNFLNYKIGVSGTGRITGKITYSNNGTGIPDVSVNLTNITGTVASAITDISGYYSISGIPEGDYSVNASGTAFFENSTGINLNASETMEVNLILWLKDDPNNNGIPADAGDLVLMKRTSIGETEADSRYDLNNNGQFADAGDLVLMKRTSIGEIIL